MRKNTWKKLTSCLLSVAMLLGVCTTSFAAFPQDEFDYVKGVIEDAKAEIESIIDLAENKTNEQKLDAVKNVLATYDVAPETVDAVIAIIEDEAAEIFEIIENETVFVILRS